MTDEVIHSAVDLFAPLTDGPEAAALVARRFVRAMEESAGEAALEIGVRAGGMSAIFCRLAAAPFMVISVDPWGRAPYFEVSKVRRNARGGRSARPSPTRSTACSP